MNPDPETIGLDSARSGGINRLLSLSDTERLRRVDQYKLAVIFLRLLFSNEDKAKKIINYINQYIFYKDHLIPYRDKIECFATNQ